MSHIDDACKLRAALAHLHHRGRILLRTGPSMEQASHFNELTGAFLSPVDVDAPSMESIEDPAQMVRVTMEGIGSVLKGLIKVVTGRNADGTKDEKVGAKLKADDYAEVIRKMEKGFTNKAWLDTAAFVSPASLLSQGTRNAAFFYRGGNGVRDIDDIVKEFTQDVSGYLAILNSNKSNITAYSKWASETWAKVEEHYEKHENEEEVYSEITAIIKAQMAKRPVVPSERANINNQARLGFPSPDQFTGKDKYSGDDIVWIGKREPEFGAMIKLAPLTRETVGKATALYEKINAALLTVESFDDDLMDKYWVNGFDDYPFRDDLMTIAVQEAGDNAWCFDAHYSYDHVDGLVSIISKRLEGMGDAIYRYIRDSFVNQP